jgi:two-component system, OmpR family, response regulator RegX3
MKSRIVVVDDDAMNARVLGLVLDDEGYEPVTSTGGEDAITKIAHTETDLVILSVEMKGTDGFQLLKELRAEGYHGPVIFISADSAVASKLEAFRLGADDYVVKPYDVLEMMARIQSVIRRFKIADQVGEGRFIRVEDAELDVGRLTYKSDVVPPTVLTPTEMRILQCLMHNQGITISRTTLINRVWGFDFVGDSNRVDVYIRRIRRKIEANQHEHEYLHTVRGLGYVFAVRRSHDRFREVETGEQCAVSAR